MPNILVLGAAGFLGNAVSQSLLRSGNHTVFGMTRAASKAKSLTAAEITPVIGEATSPDVLADAIAKHHIDTVINCTMANQGDEAILNGAVQAAKARASVLSKDQAEGPRLGFVYTSGSWVHGSPGRENRTDDLTPPGTSLSASKPATMVGWRPAHEQAILAASRSGHLDVAILRPSAIYGRTSWAWSAWFGPLLKAAGSQDTVHLPVDPASRTGTIHVDDLGAAFLAATDRIHGQLGSWPVFDLLSETLSSTDILSEAARVLGISQERLVYDGTMGNPFLEALSLKTNSAGSRARTAALGDWQPKRRDFIGNLPVLLAAWKATQEGQE